MGDHKAHASQQRDQALYAGLPDEINRRCDHMADNCFAGMVLGRVSNHRHPNPFLLQLIGHLGERRRRPLFGRPSRTRIHRHQRGTW